MKYNRTVLLVIVTAALLIVPSMIITPVRSAGRQLLRPVTSALYAKNVTVRRWVGIVHNLSSLPAQNDTLSGQVAELSAENARLKEVDHENTLLRAELQVSPVGSPRHIVAARVTNSSPFSYLDRISIDRGGNDGIKGGQAVTIHGNLVGKIVSVSDKSADVLLITSIDSIVQAELQNSRTNGVVRGGIHGLVLESIPQDTSVTVGENIVTNGLGGSLRPGLLIGTVSGIISKKNDIFQSIAIKPAINLSLVDVVFVEIGN